jgi:hypothetical protein
LVSFAVKNMGGMVPQTNARLIPEPNASDAWNVDFSAGTVVGLPVPLEVISLTALNPALGTSVAGAGILKAWRFPGPAAGDDDVWQPLPSPFSSVVKSPLTNDTLHRIYWTNPNDGAYWTTYAMLAAGTLPYSLGFISPTSPGVAGYTPTVTATGGTSPDVTPYVDRSYLVTFFDAYGAESSPSVPSIDVAGASDGVWTIDMKTTAPGAVAGFNYPPVIGCYLYRTVTSSQSGAQFYRVAAFNFSTNPPPSGGYVDGSLDADIVANLPLATSEWAPPLAGLDGLIALPGGFLCGFTGNTLHFCEPDYPHTWPAEYDLSCGFNIVGLALWQNSLVVLTEGFPQTGTGTSPANFTLTAVEVPEPCISRGSIITDLLGVYYASQNGLIMLNYYGMLNQTLSLISKLQWNDPTKFNAPNIIACRHRAQYIAITGTGIGFLIDYTNQRAGVEFLNTFEAVDSIWNDPFNGKTYVMAAKVVYEYDAQDQPNLPCKWISKEFYMEAPVNFGACQITCSPDIYDTPSGDIPPLSNGDTTLELPAGINAVFSLYAGGQLVMQDYLTETRNIFRLPSGFKAFDWQFELLTLVEIYGVEIAETMQELKKV